MLTYYTITMITIIVIITIIIITLLFDINYEVNTV